MREWASNLYQSLKKKKDNWWKKWKKSPQQVVLPIVLMLPVRWPGEAWGEDEATELDASRRIPSPCFEDGFSGNVAHVQQPSRENCGELECPKVDSTRTLILLC